MYRFSCVVFCVLFSFLCLSDVSAQGSGSETTGGNKAKITGPSQRAMLIFNRAKILTANVVNVSKGAKGVGMPITSREHWDIIGKSPAFKNVISDAEKYQKEIIPLPTEEDYMRFYETLSKGRDYEAANKDYEDAYNKRRDRLYKLVLAECIENKGRFIEDIEMTILVICSAEPTWTIPWEDPDAEKFLGKNLTIDHLIARTAWDLATTSYWLGRKLSTETRELLDLTVKLRVLSKFEEAILTDNYDLASWANSDGHRNADGHAAVVGTALALIDSAEHRAQYIAAAEHNVEKFLKMFTRDGYFQDGIWAWNEGYGSFILLAEMMYQATDGRIDMFKRPNIKETALYGPRMEIIKGVYEIFGDRWRGDRPNLFPTAFVSMRFQMGLKDFEERAPFFGVGPGHLYNVGVYCFPNSATEKKGQPGEILTPPLETLRSEFALNGVMVLRSGKKDSRELAVQLKGGNNEERGNHSDVGTYVVAFGGSKPLIDIGSRHYRRWSSGNIRMDSNFVNSFGHPVPKTGDSPQENRMGIQEFGMKIQERLKEDLQEGLKEIQEYALNETRKGLQKNGRGTICPLLTREFTDKKDTLKYDLQYVYEWSDPKDVKEFTRTFVYNREDKDADSRATFTVTDYFRVKKALPYENCLITFGPFKKLTEADDAASIDLIIGEGNNAIHVNVSNEVTEIVDSEGGKTKYAKVPKPFVFEAGLLDEPLAGGRDKRIPIRLGFGFETPVDEVTMTIKIRPAKDAEKNLAKNAPGTPDRTYTSPIDEIIEEDKKDMFAMNKEEKPEEMGEMEEGKEGEEGMEGEEGEKETKEEKEAKAQQKLFAQYLEMLRNLIPPDKIAGIKTIPKDQLKAQFKFLKMTNPKAKDFPDISDEQLEAFIEYLQENL